MVLQTIVEQCVASLGYELVDIEHGPAGMLRVFIDVIPESAQAGQPAATVEPAPQASAEAVWVPSRDRIRIEDCERVSHQLSHLLMVEDVDYARLEVSSPGLDRPLKKAADFERFVGFEVSVRLRMPFQGQRNFEGVLSIEEDGRFGLTLDDSPKPALSAKGRPTGRVAVKKTSTKTTNRSKGADAAAGEVRERKLVFALEEIDRARLVPKVKF